MTRLTPREREIVELVGGQGLPYKTAAKMLGISWHTVREHVRRIAQRQPPQLSPRWAVVKLYYSDEWVTIASSTSEGD